MAHSRAAGPAGPYAEALTGERGQAGLAIGNVWFIVPGRGRHRYEWAVRPEARPALIGG